MIKSIYERCDNKFTSTAELSMNAFLANIPKCKFSKHEYTIEGYGLTEADVRERLSGYRERCNNPCKN